MPPVLSFKRSMYRTRREVIPPNPNHQVNIDVAGSYLNMPNGNSIVVGDDQGTGTNDRILLFSAPELVTMAGRTSRINIDCTFKCSPMNYTQLFVLFGLINESVWLPLFYATLPNKQQNTYERLYNLIDMAMAYESASFRADLHVMMDYELAERRPWIDMYPSHQVKACYFHFTQVKPFIFDNAIYKTCCLICFF